MFERAKTKWTKEKMRTSAKMRADGGVTGSASQVLVLTVRNVLVSFRIAIALSQPKIYTIENTTFNTASCQQTNYVYNIRFLSKPNQEVVRFDVAMHKILRVNVFNTWYLSVRTYTLQANHEKTSWSASINTVLRLNLRLQYWNRSSRLGPRRSITITLYSPSLPKYRTSGIPTDTHTEPGSCVKRHTHVSATAQNAVKIVLVGQLRMSCLDWLEFDSNWLVGLNTFSYSETKCMAIAFTEPLKISPKLPLPIFSSKRYLPPMRRSTDMLRPVSQRTTDLAQTTLAKSLMLTCGGHCWYFWFNLFNHVSNDMMDADKVALLVEALALPDFG